jgi:hypothetical protein
MNLKTKALLIVLTLIVVLPVGLFAFPSHAQAATCGQVDTAPIMTVNSVQTGSIKSYNSSSYLYVQFNTSGTGWKVSKAYFHPATYFGGLPKKADGSLDYTRFAYQRSYSTPVTSNTFQVGRGSSWLDGSEMHMGMYLVLVKLNSAGQIIQTTGAWGRTKNVNNAWYFKHMYWWCTPHTGTACQNYYWGSSSHYNQWQGYSPSQSFNSVFGRNAYASTLTLGQALSLSGRSLDTLARHATAALLNANHSGVDYPYSVSQVIQKFRAAYDIGNYQSSANVFYYANNLELSCPLP